MYEEDLPVNLLRRVVDELSGIRDEIAAAYGSDVANLAEAGRYKALVAITAIEKRSNEGLIAPPRGPKNARLVDPQQPGLALEAHISLGRRIKGVEALLGRVVQHPLQQRGTIPTMQKVVDVSRPIGDLKNLLDSLLFREHGDHTSEELPAVYYGLADPRL
jgi:hypothetical protein